MATHHPEKVAPVHMHNPAFSSSSSSSVQQFTVGKLDAGMAILLGSRASLIEFPSLLLPQDVTSGSVVEIVVKRNVDQERRNKREFDDLQRDILDTFGRAGPVAPQLGLRAVTQTSVVLEWSAMELASAKLLSLDIYRNNARLAAIPNPLQNTSTKLSGLDVGAEYAFHLVLKTTAGTLQSNTIRTKTHLMTDTSGISVCFGAVEGGAVTESAEADEPVTQLEALARDLLQQMGAKASTKLQIDTTHYVCTSPRARSSAAAGANGQTGEGATYRKAMQLNIPIIRPEWVVACWEAKKMVPISSYYIDKEPPNQESVRSLLSKQDARQSVSQQQPDEAATAAAAASATAAPPAEAADAQPVMSPPAREDKEQPPPPPASKDGDEDEAPAAVQATVSDREVVEPETAAVTESRQPEAGGLGAAGGESMEDVSLTGGAGAGKAEEGGADGADDDDEGEEVDLS